MEENGKDVRDANFQEDALKELKRLNATQSLIYDEVKPIRKYIEFMYAMLILNIIVVVTGFVIWLLQTHC